MSHSKVTETKIESKPLEAQSNAFTEENIALMTSSFLLNSHTQNSSATQIFL